jgi:cytochrome c biogenesis protein ResB
VAGANVTVIEKNGAVHEGIVWGMADQPFLARIGDQSWSITLQRRRWQLPFTVRLEQFTRELHPGTSIPAAFSSDVTVEEPDATQHFHIAMNRPLRYKGYTLFQASWGPTDAGPNDRLFSTFAVVRNPADQFPLYACIVIAAGLLVHFSQRLISHLQQQPGRT